MSDSAIDLEAVRWLLDRGASLKDAIEQVKQHRVELEEIRALRENTERAQTEIRALQWKRALISLHLEHLRQGNEKRRQANERAALRLYVQRYVHSLLEQPSHVVR